MDRSTFPRWLDEIVADYVAVSLQEWSLAEAFRRVMRLGEAQHVLMPQVIIVLMRTIFLAEHVVYDLYWDFRLIESVHISDAKALKEAREKSDWAGGLERLRIEALTAMHDLPGVLGTWTRQLRQEVEGLGLGLHLHRIERLEEHLNRSINRVALALVTLGALRRRFLANAT